MTTRSRPWSVLKDALENDPFRRIWVPVPGGTPPSFPTAMPVHLYALLTWTTAGRQVLIRPPVAEFLSRFLPVESQRHGAHLLALGIVADHVHAVLELPLKVDVPRLVQGLKGASARIANRDGYAGRGKLQWAEGYDLRSVGVRQLKRAIGYVRRQNTRHPGLAIGQGTTPGEVDSTG